MAEKVFEYTESHIDDARKHETLGAEYFAARDFVRSFMKNWQEEHAVEIAGEIIKPLIDTIQERVNDAFRDHLINDAEDNIEGIMRGMVEASVRALIGGDNWAYKKYIKTEYGDGKKVRETLAKLYSDEIKDGRIADLEKQVAELKKDLEWFRR